MELILTLLVHNSHIYLFNPNRKLFCRIPESDSHDIAEPSDEGCEKSRTRYVGTLHIAAIFVIMLVSFLGTMLPTTMQFLSIRASSGRTAVQILKLFGAGVILSTSYVHMFVPAQKFLSSPCLPTTFSAYEAWAGVFALVGLFLSHSVQSLASVAVRKRLRREEGKHITALSERQHGRSRGADLEHTCGIVTIQSAHLHARAVAGAERKATVYILEAGVACHSVIVGITLGLARGGFHICIVGTFLS